ncbi:LysR family transcriptional regulator [Alisedimentitalea sp. MJ-SS2]|uniref:LysR family transcriptional regulator n=1 Tax=Aliisedimentitalea sp. MJ-SS2 TaxID=3049795 RepID=UPI0029127525|nr:LysR family transcriptional regulator [Alisedimentitalea sp. MJ-SS2]MDU8929454.1 LysR family transcriptional regulator [Alisedimentitalea sp. MJ-SS2]
MNLLRVLDALLQEGSTVGAARRIGLTQPAVSAALARLRDALDDPLLTRLGRALEPTQFALDLKQPLHDKLAEIENLLSAPSRFDPKTAQLDFRIAGSDFFAELLMPDLARHLAANAPGIRVQLVNLVPDDYVETLEQFEIEMALIPRVDFPPWAESRDVIRSTFSLIARAGHPRLAQAGLSPGDTIPIDLYCDLGHVLFSPEGRTTGMGDDALAAVGRDRQVVMTMPVFSGVYNAVAESDLIALLPTQLANRVAPRLGLSLYQAPMPLPTPTLCMMWHRRATSSPAHAWLRDQIAVILAPITCLPLPVANG